MLFRVQSAAVCGIKAYPVSLEVYLSTGQKLNRMTVSAVLCFSAVSNNRIHDY